MPTNYRMPWDVYPGSAVTGPTAALATGLPQPGEFSDDFFSYRFRMEQGLLRRRRIEFMFASSKKRGITRNTNGSGIVEGVVGLWMVIFGAVGAVLLLANIGMTCYYKTEVGFVADECARYAANQARCNNGYGYDVYHSIPHHQIAALANKM